MVSLVRAESPSWTMVNPSASYCQSPQETTSSHTWSPSVCPPSVVARLRPMVSPVSSVQ
nr:MAG TPA: hypothetical protein [Caudoviricetes sp.]